MCNICDRTSLECSDFSAYRDRCADSNWHVQYANKMSFIHRRTAAMPADDAAWAAANMT